MAVLSVDLAFQSWSDLGIVVLERQAARQATAAVLGGPLRLTDLAPPIPLEAGRATAEETIACEIVAWNDPGPVDADVLAGKLNHMCSLRGIRIMMLDGPQAWKSDSNGLEFARVSERQLNTAAKTGLPGVVKPVTYRKFAEFCLDVYEALCRRGWMRLDSSDHPAATAQRVLVESYPHAAWKSLGLTPLPSKRKAGAIQLAEALGALKALMPITVDREPNHDQLQAIVGGLPGLALECLGGAGAQIVGTAPRRENGHWREGFIVLPVAPRRSAPLRWLD
jgi:hypothetical protein